MAQTWGGSGRWDSEGQNTQSSLTWHYRVIQSSTNGEVRRHMTISISSQKPNSSTVSASIRTEVSLRYLGLRSTVTTPNSHTQQVLANKTYFKGHYLAPANQIRTNITYCPQSSRPAQIQSPCVSPQDPAHSVPDPPVPTKISLPMNTRNARRFAFAPQCAVFTTNS